MGSESLWDRAESALEKVLKEQGYRFRFNRGDGAFYGPKIDIHIKDALNRSHQCATVQLDFQMPEKFDLTYIDEKTKSPSCCHSPGSIRFSRQISRNHYRTFRRSVPLWLAPVQAKIIPVSNTAHRDCAEQVHLQMKKAGIRAELDQRDEKLGYKIREAQMKKYRILRLWEIKSAATILYM